MADEYIKRSDAIKAVDNLCHVYFTENKAKLEAIPAEDVAPVQKWIPVSERLPEEEKVVLCHCRANIIETLAYYDGLWQGYSSCYIKSFVTHWMPLPEPPKEGE